MVRKVIEVGEYWIYVKIEPTQLSDRLDSGERVKSLR